MKTTPKQQLLIALQLKQPGWYLRTADFEKCVCRVIGPYEIEVSGGSKHPIRFHVYVWKKERTYRIVERVTDIDPRCEDVPSLVCSIAERYVQKAVVEGTYIKPPPTTQNGEAEDLPF